MAMDLIVIFIVYGILFLGELGDKTQLIIFNLSLEYENSYKIGLGAMLGFAVIVTLGVFIGDVITIFIPIIIISIISGLVFIIIGFLEARDLKNLYNEYKNKEIQGEIKNIQPNQSYVGDLNPKKSSILNNLKKNPYLAGFSSIFIMELGDKTQILTITLSFIYPSPFEVWIGAFLALISLAWMGVFFGSIIAKKVPKFHLKLISVIIFIFIGILIILTSS